MISGEGQARGNSGCSWPLRAAGITAAELQILDSCENKTYVNGQAGSIYKQQPPLVNANRKPGEWQTYDVIWTAPVFNADGTVKSPAYVTAFHNGVLIQNHTELKGETVYIGKPFYKVARQGADQAAVALAIRASQSASATSGCANCSEPSRTVANYGKRREPLREESCAILPTSRAPVRRQIRS